MAEVVVDRGYSQITEETYKAPRAYKDVEWAIIWLIHLVLVVVLGVVFAPELIREISLRSNQEPADKNSMSPEVQDAVSKASRMVIPFIGIGAAIGLGWAILWISIVQRYAESLIWAALLASPVIFGTLTLVTLILGSPASIGFGIAFAITAIYAAWIITSQRFRIEFAQLTLETVARVIKQYPGMWISSFLSIIPSAIWAFGWLFALAAVAVFYVQRGEKFTYTDRYGNEREGYDIPTMGKVLIAYLCLSNYWTAQVIVNVVHVTVSGTMASWYFMQQRMPSSPTLLSFKRSVTTSFGSICLGSLLVALVQLLRDLVEDARRNQEGCVGMVIMCCVSCIMGWIEFLVELFNHWAFVQVAIYGKDFKTAAKDTWQLVQTKGLTGLVNMNLTTQACSLGSFIGAALAAGIVALVAYAPLVGRHSDESEDVKNVYIGFYAGLIAFSALLSLVFTSMVSSTVTSGVTTLFVCWAEDPVALRDSNPALHAKFEEVSAKFLEDRAQEHSGIQPPPNTGVYGQPINQGNAGPYGQPANATMARNYP